MRTAKSSDSKPMKPFSYPFRQLFLFWMAISVVGVCFAVGFYRRLGSPAAWLVGGGLFLVASWLSFWKWGQGAARYAARQQAETHAKQMEETKRRADRLEADLQRLADLRIAATRVPEPIPTADIPDLKRRLAQKEWELELLQATHQRMLAEYQKLLEEKGD
jgi:hypothetical protein